MKLTGSRGQGFKVSLINFAQRIVFSITLMCGWIGLHIPHTISHYQFYLIDSCLLKQILIDIYDCYYTKNSIFDEFFEDDDVEYKQLIFQMRAKCN